MELVELEILQIILGTKMKRILRQKLEEQLKYKLESGMEFEQS